METPTLPATPAPVPSPPPPPHPPAPDLSRIAQDLQIRKVQVESVVQLLDEGNTVPFITRYRKERTGGLNEEVIRRIQFRVGQLRHLAERKLTILKSIENQGKLTDDLRTAILAADNPKRLEDLYLPFKPKKRTLATEAREKGLEPLALAVWDRDPVAANLAEVVAGMVDPEKQLNSPDDILQGVRHILAEKVAETADVRAAVRRVIWDTGKIAVGKSESLAEGQGLEYKDYFQFTETVRHIPPHRILAINRGEKEKALAVKLEFDGDLVRRVSVEPLPLADHPHRDFLYSVVEDALTRLLLPSLEREVRRELTEHAQDHAIGVFARNLRSLLLQPPLRGKRVLAVDPGFRTGCKLAALDETGNLLEHGVIFPHPPQKKAEPAKAKLEEFVRRHQVGVIAIGNGTACRETEELVSALIAELAAGNGIRPKPPELPPPPPPPPAPVEASAATAEPLAPTAAEPPPVAAPAIAGMEPPPIIPAEAVAPPVVAEAAPPAPEPAAVAEVVATAISSVEPPPVVPPPTDVPAAAPEAVPAATAPELPPPPPAEPAPPLPPAPADLAYVIVNEAGASDYSASPVGREEFPNFDATLRGTISIGRRLQDPLSELVKIDPQHVGVGLYQHDVHPKHLKECLEGVIESCVNHVGVDLNTASIPLLRHVSGLNQLVARELVEYRRQHGPFHNREQLMQVPSVGPVRFVQAAGFLKIAGGDNPLDGTWIHPESYMIAGQVLADLDAAPDVLRDRAGTEALREKLKGVNPHEVAGRLHAGEPTVHDILDALARPGRDPREDLPPPIFKKGVLKLEDLQPGMELKGTVLNVVDFGAFIDVGLKDSGLVHISRMANRYIKSPHEVVAVGDVVTVWVLTIDLERRRVSLTMIPPGQERKPPERRPPQPREQRPPVGQGQGQPGGPPRRGPRPPQQHPPRGRRPAPGPAGGAGGQPEAPPPPRPAPPRPERRPPKPRPLPTLTQAKKEGKAYLNTLGELEAYFKSRETPAEAPPAPPPPPEPAPTPEAPPPAGA